MPVVIYVHTFTKVNEKPTKIVLNRTIKKWDQMMKKIPSMDSGRPVPPSHPLPFTTPKNVAQGSFCTCLRAPRMAMATREALQ